MANKMNINHHLVLSVITLMLTYNYMIHLQIYHYIYYDYQ